MDGRELNRGAVAVVLSVGVMVGAYGVARSLVPDTPPARLALMLPGHGAVLIGSYLERADVSSGARMVKQVCGGCHTFQPGGDDAAGPNLFGVVGRPVASVPGYAYSDALRHAGTGRVWTEQALSDWLSAPDRFAPGTRMSLNGVTDPALRADIIVYLRTLRQPQD
jgi:cytochrome c